MRRDEFTLEEYRKLHTVGRKWIAEADKPSGIWYRTVTYNMILIACNTGMRPAEMKNLRWRDIMPAKDREGREIVVLFVQGKGNPQQAAAELVRLEQVVSAFTAGLPEFASGLADFWDFHGPVVEHHLRKRQTLKSVFGGDVFPSYTASYLPCMQISSV
jgi:hypothetical protein